MITIYTSPLPFHMTQNVTVATIYSQKHVITTRTSWYLVVPYLNKPVVSAGDQVWLVTAMVVVHTVDALLMTLQSEVGRTRPKIPHLCHSNTAFSRNTV